MDAKKTKKHFAIIDLARGFAILLMFIYHFCYDLDYFSYIQANFNTGEFWINFRIIIVTLFLSIMGISLYLATHPALNSKRFKQRLALLAVYALLVSISSWVMFPNAMILFGILHFIFVASLLGLLFVRLGVVNLFLGIGIILMGQNLEYEIFNPVYLNWIGMMTRLPVTVDYVPLFPWFGVVLIGIYLGQRFRQLPADSVLRNWTSRHPVSNTLILGGRYSLHIYMLHQPLFLGILYIISLFTG